MLKELVNKKLKVKIRHMLSVATYLYCLQYLHSIGCALQAAPLLEARCGLLLQLAWLGVLSLESDIALLPSSSFPSTSQRVVADPQTD